MTHISETSMNRLQEASGNLLYALQELAAKPTKDMTKAEKDFFKGVLPLYTEAVDLIEEYTNYNLYHKALEVDDEV